MKKIIPIFCCVFLTLVLLGCPNEPVEPYIPEFSVYLAKTDTDYTTIHVKQGDTVSKPEDPTRDYYNFLGWVIVTYDENGNTVETPYDFSTPVTTDHLWIHAKWEPIQKNYVAASETVKFIENLAIVDEFCQDLHTLVVTGELTLENLDQILTAIYHTDLQINLDLTQTTGLTELKPVEGKNYLFAMGSSSSDKGIYKLSLPRTIKKIDTNILWRTDACRSLYFDGTIADWCAIDFVPCSEIYMEEERFWGHSPFRGFASTTVQIGSVVMKEGMDLVIPEGTTHIDDYAFYQLNPKTVTLPSTLKTVGREAFQLYDEDWQDENEPSIEAVKFNGKIEQYATINYTDLSSNPKYYSNTLYLAGENISELESFSISLTNDIGSYAFVGLNNLTGLDIAGATSISDYAFYDCTNIQNLTCKLENQKLKDIFYETNSFFPSLKFVTIKGEKICTEGFTGVEYLSILDLQVKIIETESISVSTIDNFIIPYATEIQENAISGTIKKLGLPLAGVDNLHPNSFYYCTLENLEISYSDLVELSKTYSPFDVNEGGVTVKFYAGKIQTFDGDLFKDTMPQLTLIIQNPVNFEGYCNYDICVKNLEDWCKCTFESEYSKSQILVKNDNGEYESPKTVVVPNGIKKINSFAFKGLGNSYESEYAPTIYLNEVEEIGEGAFWNLGYEIDENGNIASYATINLGEYITEIPIFEKTEGDQTWYSGVFNHAPLEKLVFYPSVKKFSSDVVVKNLVFKGTVEQFLSIENPKENETSVDYNWIQDDNLYFEDLSLVIEGLVGEVLEIPEGITKIYSHQLYYIKNGHPELNTIILPKSLETLCENAFNPEDFQNIYYRGTEEELQNIKGDFEIEIIKDKITCDYTGSGE